MPHRSAVPYRTEGAGTRVDALADARIDVSEEVTDGLLVETGENPEWETTDLVVPQHSLAVHLDTEPVVIERKNERGVFEREVMDPGTVWVNPAERPFSRRVAHSNRFGLLVLDPDLVGRLTGREETDLTLAYGANDPQLEHLARAVFVEAAAGTPSGPAFTQTFATALATRLLQRFGMTPLSDDLGDSDPAHLTRQFKQHVGRTPSAFRRDAGR